VPLRWPPSVGNLYKSCHLKSIGTAKSLKLNKLLFWHPICLFDGNVAGK
jgi:hypothetical protein